MRFCARVQHSVPLLILSLWRYLRAVTNAAACAFLCKLRSLSSQTSCCEAFTPHTKQFSGSAPHPLHIFFSKLHLPGLDAVFHYWCQWRSRVKTSLVILLFLTLVHPRAPVSCSAAAWLLTAELTFFSLKRWSVISCPSPYTSVCSQAHTAMDGLLSSADAATCGAVLQKLPRQFKTFLKK